MNDAWENDTCPECGGHVDWDEDLITATIQTWKGVCEGCNAVFKARLTSTVESVIKVG